MKELGLTTLYILLPLGVVIFSETFVAVHTSDVAAGGVYLLILMTFGKRVIRAILPAYRDNYTTRTEIETLSLQSMKRMVKQRAFPSILSSLGLAVLVVALGAGVSLFIPGEASTVVAILGITTLAIGNRNIIFAGITTGIIGCAAGNYLGVLLANLLTLF